VTNALRTTLLLGLLTALLLAAGGAVGGRAGLVLALGLAVVVNAGSYWYSDRVVLRMYRAREVSEREAPELHAVVREVARAAGLPMPRVCVVPQPALNAFATGRDPEHAVVAVTEGLLAHLDREELAGVLAHEIAHVRNRDILVGAVAATLAGAVMTLASLARWGAIFGGLGDDEEGGGGILALLLTALLAPLAALLVQAAVSRSREFEADATGARLLGSGTGLARALGKLAVAERALPTAAPAAAGHLLIASPLRGRGLAGLFATHPPIEERIARLRTGVALRHAA